MIPANKLNDLKRLFAEDGFELDDQQALEIGLWLISQVKPFVKKVPLDKMDLFGKMREELEAIRRKEPLVNLLEWRRKNM